MAVRSRESSSHHLNCGVVGTLMRGSGLLWKQLMVQRECTSVAGLSLLEIQFNGIGRLLTYVSLRPDADVSVLGFYGEAQCRNLVL